MEVKVNVEILNKIGEYLSEKPYKEVYHLLDMLQNSVQELNKELNKEEKPSE